MDNNRKRRLILRRNLQKRKPQRLSYLSRLSFSLAPRIALSPSLYSLIAKNQSIRLYFHSGGVSDVIVIGGHWYQYRRNLSIGSPAAAHWYRSLLFFLRLIFCYYLKRLSSRTLPSMPVAIFVSGFVWQQIPFWPCPSRLFPPSIALFVCLRMW